MLRNACELEDLCWSVQAMELGDITWHKLRLPFAHIPLNTSFTATRLVQQNATHGTENESLYTIKKQDIWPWNKRKKKLHEEFRLQKYIAIPCSLNSNTFSYKELRNMQWQIT